MWGRGTKKKVGIHLRLLGIVRFSFGEWKRGLEKKICTLCVILMEDGERLDFLMLF
jgi:hypothetical protein